MIPDKVVMGLFLTAAILIGFWLLFDKDDETEECNDSAR